MSSRYISFPSLQIAGIVTSINDLTGNITIEAGDNITIDTSGNILTINAAADVGANAALSNLASVAINQSLVPGPDKDLDIGSPSKRYNILHTLFTKFYGDISGGVLIGAPDEVDSYSLTLPDEQGASNTYLKNNGSGILSWATVSGGGSPGGSDKAVQFNDGGSTFGGQASFTFDKTLSALTLGVGVATGQSSFAFGTDGGGGPSLYPTASDEGAFAHGVGCKAQGMQSYAGGNQNLASANNAHAEGQQTTASGLASHSEGTGDGGTLGRASGDSSHVEGQYGMASGQASHSEGRETHATGQYSHSQNQLTVASGIASDASGLGTVAAGDNQSVVGQYNVSVGTPGDPQPEDEIWTVGNGADDMSRNTVCAVLRSGEFQWNGSGGTDNQVLTSAGPGATPTWENVPNPSPTAARAYSSTTTISGSLATIVYATEDYDPSNSYDETTGIYTAPFNGRYQVNASLLFAGTIALNNTVIMEIQINGTVKSRKTVYLPAALTDGNISISDIIELSHNDEVQIQVSTSATTPTIVSSNFDNYFSIARIF